MFAIHREEMTANGASATWRLAMNSLPNMATTSTESNITLVNLEADLLSLLDSITNLAIDPPSLYLDLKGVNLGRHGSISILSLHIAPTKKNYLVDVYSLGKLAFLTTNSSGTSLKTTLESSIIPKVFFDIRSSSDALFNLFQISVDGIKDLQLMELAYRTGSREFVSSLDECVQKESPVSAVVKTEWSLAKRRDHRLLVPEHDGSYEAFNERPLKPETTQYCAQDVMLLPGLYNVYNTKLRQPGKAFWRVHIREKTKNRIQISQSPDYDEKSMGDARGWSDYNIEQDIESWNDDIMLEAMAGHYTLNENDDWVPAPEIELDNFFDEEEEEDDDNDWYNDTARDCIGWEDDMIRNGEF